MNSKKIEKSICNLGFSANMHNIFRHCKDWCDIPCKTNVIWHVISITFICLQLFFYLIRRLYSYLYSMINNYKNVVLKWNSNLKSPCSQIKSPHLVIYQIHVLALLAMEVSIYTFHKSFIFLLAPTSILCTLITNYGSVYMISSLGDLGIFCQLIKQKDVKVNQWHICLACYKTKHAINTTKSFLETFHTTGIKIEIIIGESTTYLLKFNWNNCWIRLENILTELI